MKIKICQHCGKGIMRGNRVSHAKQRTKRVLKPNLHWQKITIDGVKKRLLLCTKCTRFLKKKALQKQEKAKAQKKEKPVIKKAKV